MHPWCSFCFCAMLVIIGSKCSILPFDFFTSIDDVCLLAHPPYFCIGTSCNHLCSFFLLMLISIIFADLNIYLSNSNLDSWHWWVIIICLTLHNHITKFIAQLLQLWHSSHFFPRNNTSPQQWQSICQVQNICISGQLLKSALRNTQLYSPKHLTIITTSKLYYKIWLPFLWIMYQVWCLLWHFQTIILLTFNQFQLAAYLSMIHLLSFIWYSWILVLLCWLCTNYNKCLMHLLNWQSHL